MINEKQQWKQRIRMIVSAGASLALVALLVQNYRARARTGATLGGHAEVVPEFAHNESADRGHADTRLALEAGRGGFQDVRRQHNLEEIKNVGWQLAN
jgi:hypothetical protein